jgi:hypothetical protein
VLERVAVVGDPHGLLDLAAHQPGERAGLDPHRLGAQVGQEVRGAGEQVVACENRHGVRPPRVGGRLAPPERGLVHHVVVVERRQMGQLHHDGGRDDSGCRRIAELRGEQDQHGPEPLAARRHQMLGGLGQQRLLAVDRLQQQGLDVGEPLLHLRGERVVHSQTERNGSTHRSRPF